MLIAPLSKLWFSFGQNQYQMHKSTWWMLVKWGNFYLYSSQFSSFNYLWVLCPMNCNLILPLFFLLCFNFKHPFQFFPVSSGFVVRIYTLYSSVLVQFCLCFLFWTFFFTNFFASICCLCKWAYTDFHFK